MTAHRSGGALVATTVAVGLALAALGLGAAAAPRPSLRSIERGHGDGPLVVLLHGFGSRPEDIVSLADRTDLPPGTRLSFPYAPERTQPPNGPPDRFMWWRFTTALRSLPRTPQPGLARARDRVLAFLDQQEERLGITSDRIVLGGFSQGAMVALDVALHDDRPLAGLLLLSGTPVDEAELAPLVASRRGLRVYVSHGTADDVLPYESATHLVDLLREGGVDVRLRSFDGGHVVPPIVGTDVASFLTEVTR